MIKLNAAGHQLIDEFLKTNVLASAWDNPRLQSIVAKARGGNDVCIVLDARFTVTGSTQVCIIPPEGFALSLPWEAFTAFANNAKWTTITNACWGIKVEEDNGDIEEADERPANGFNQVSLETSAHHPSGKLITVVYEVETFFRINGSDDQNPDKISSGTWSIDGLTLIGPKGAPLTYQAMHDHFEKSAGRFGHRSGRFATDMRTIDASKLVPNSGGVTEVDMDKEEDCFMDGDGVHHRWESEVLARVSSEDVEVEDSFIGWQEWKLKIAAGGIYICEKNLRPVKNDDQLQYLGGFFKTKTAVVAFFGQGPLAKRIYRQAGIAG